MSPAAGDHTTTRRIVSRGPFTYNTDKKRGIDRLPSYAVSSLDRLARWHRALACLITPLAPCTLLVALLAGPAAADDTRRTAVARHLAGLSATATGSIGTGRLWLTVFVFWHLKFRGSY
jgi:hypothetical protein